MVWDSLHKANQLCQVASCHNLWEELSKVLKLSSYHARQCVSGHKPRRRLRKAAPTADAAPAVTDDDLLDDVLMDTVDAEPMGSPQRSEQDQLQQETRVQKGRHHVGTGSSQKETHDADAQDTDENRRPDVSQVRVSSRHDGGNTDWEGAGAASKPRKRLKKHVRPFSAD